ncbi:MAG: DUF2817 domain-containing protein [Deltaproteobacteria bacterium]|nr:DUF2817 domain-containing protein [Deltaproteobacteria bacterium]
MKWMNVLLIIMMLGIFACAGKTYTVTSDKCMSSFFSTDYLEARNKFLAAAEAIGASIESFQNSYRG